MAKKRGTSSKNRGGGSTRTRNSIDLDFSDVKKFTVPNGTYLIEITKATIKKSKSNNDMLEIIAEIAEGKQAGFEIREYVSLTQNALFRVQAMLDGFGYDYKVKGKFTLAVDELIGLQAYAVLQKETNDQGYESSRIVSYADDGAEDEDEDYDEDDDDYEDEDNEDSDDEDDEDEDDFDAEEEVSALDKDELDDLAEELGISSKKWRSAKNKKAKIKLILGQDEEDIEEAFDELGLGE